jgi:predicted flap endonuclease-1-like 5' DNA nuclease
MIMENVICLLTNFPWDLLLFLLVLGALLWWLINRWVGGRLKDHTEELYHRISQLESENGKLRRQFTDRTTFLESELEACRKSKIHAAPTGFAAVSDKSKIKKDDLKIVEGIGPKIEELFNNSGIYSFDDLAQASIEHLKSILDKAGSRFQIHDPSTWPRQSELARDGKWEELKKWQEELNKGK